MVDATAGSEIDWKASYFAALRERDVQSKFIDRLLNCIGAFSPEVRKHWDDERSKLSNALSCASPYCRRAFVPDHEEQIHCSDKCKPPGPPDPPYGGPKLKV